MSSIERLRKQIEEQDAFLRERAQYVRSSRTVVRADDTNYVDGVGVSVETLMRQVANGASVDQLIAAYAGSTHEDIKACFWFASIRGREVL